MRKASPLLFLATVVTASISAEITDKSRIKDLDINRIVRTAAANLGSESRKDCMFRMVADVSAGNQDDVILEFQYDPVKANIDSPWYLTSVNGLPPKDSDIDRYLSHQATNDSHPADLSKLRKIFSTEDTIDVIEFSDQQLIGRIRYLEFADYGIQAREDNGRKIQIDSSKPRSLQQTNMLHEVPDTEQTFDIRAQANHVSSVPEERVNGGIGLVTQQLKKRRGSITTLFAINVVSGHLMWVRTSFSTRAKEVFTGGTLKSDIKTEYSSDRNVGAVVTKHVLAQSEVVSLDHGNIDMKVETWYDDFRCP